MNNNKFCFIICVNDSLLVEESLHYISHLHIPEGYETEILTIIGAPAMTQGYQEAMTQSDARYKIYMHQDVFILNKNILSDLLSIFRSDSQIGLIGMVGYDTVSPDGIMWHAKKSGALYEAAPKTPYPALAEYRYSLAGDGFTRAAEIDGFFMATSFDLPWNTQDLKDFDFYDAYQSISFLKAGYQIAVPIQRHPWCMHDDGHILNLTNYDRYRQLFLRAHKDILGKRYDEITNPVPQA